MIRPDNVQLASMLPAYVNTSSPTATISISGTIANGNTQNFSTSLAFNVAARNVMADVYGSNNLTGAKFLLNNLLVATSGIEYSPKSTELCQMELSYNATTITVTFSVFNGTGSSITLNAQTVTIVAPTYKLPF